MPWFQVNCDLPKHPKMAALPNDAARWGWLAVLAEAKLQRKQGTFASEAHFKEVMGRHGRNLKHYVAAKLIEPRRDGSLAVHDWQHHQWAGTKAGQREDIPKTSDGQKEDPHAHAGAVHTEGVPTVPVLDEGVVKGGDETVAQAIAYLPVLDWLRAHGVQRIVGKVLNDLIEFTATDGADALIGAMEKLPNSKGFDAAQYVYGARNHLHPIPSGSSKKPNSPHLADLQAATEVV